MADTATAMNQSSSSTYNSTKRLPDAGSLLSYWQNALDSSGSDKADGKHLANRGDRAELRRCRSLNEVQLSQVFYGVREYLRSKNIVVDSEYDNKRLALTLGVLAWVKTDDANQSFARQLASRRKDSQDARLSGLRFRKLLQIDDIERLYSELIGVIRILDGRVHVADFVRDIAWWRPDTSCQIRRKWAENYYSQVPQEQ